MKVAGHYVQVSDTSHGCYHANLDVIVDGGTRMIECEHCKKRWERSSRCCLLGCGKPLQHPALPFCEEHMKDEAKVREWMEL